jgi:DNA-binding NarL/FixJ family response regulator
MKRILVADDHALIREGLKQIIATSVDLEVSDEASNGQEALAKVREHHFDAVILDITMPGRDGLDVLAEIKKMQPSLPVLILSSHPEEQCALRAFRAGASGYLVKLCSPQELLEALHKITLGKKYVSQEFAECLVSGLGKPDQEKLHNRLSGREYQVLCMIGSGKPVSKIATELSLSLKTVSTHRSNLLKKLNMHNNAEITRYAIENNLV